MSSKLEVLSSNIKLSEGESIQLRLNFRYNKVREAVDLEKITIFNFISPLVKYKGEYFTVEELLRKALLQYIKNKRTKGRAVHSPNSALLVITGKSILILD